MTRPLIIVTGPTSAGKTDRAIELCKKFNGEIVSADSRQIYIGLDIGTGKVTPADIVEKGKGAWKVNGAWIHMYDVVEPRLQFTVRDYCKVARPIIEKLWEEEKIPFITGGTWWYIKTLVEGLGTLGIPPNFPLRRKLSRVPLSDLRRKLEEVDPARFNAMNESDGQNPRRLIRAIEVAVSKIERKPPEPLATIPLYLGLTAPGEVIRQRIIRRLDARLEEGLVDEVRGLLANGLTSGRLEELGLEYRYVGRMLTGELTYVQMYEQLARSIRHFYLRQVTFMRKNKKMIWFNVTDQDISAKLEKTILEYLTSDA